MQSKEPKEKNKTWKRELAVVLLLWFAYLVETKDENLIKVLVWPVFTYSALAFGIDWYGKSNSLRQPPKPTDRGRP